MTRTGASPRSARRRRNGEVVLFVDTFNRYFEADVARAAERVLRAAGYAVTFARAGRRRAAAVLRAHVPRRGHAGRRARRGGAHDRGARAVRRRGVPIVGLEPSCLLTLRDEFLALVPTDEARAVAARRCCSKSSSRASSTPGAGRRRCGRCAQARVVHGHCHQKAFGAMPAVMRALRAIPGLDAAAIESSCCGMAGTFGYEREHYDVSMRMAERDLLPAVRAADADTLVVADGMSCKHQIAHGAGRRALHVAEVYAAALETEEPPS